jgi:hypothetical protein
MPLIESIYKECPKCYGNMSKLWGQTKSDCCEVGGTSNNTFNAIYKTQSFYECKDCGSKLLVPK